MMTCAASIPLLDLREKTETPPQATQPLADIVSQPQGWAACGLWAMGGKRKEKIDGKSVSACRCSGSCCGRPHSRRCANPHPPGDCRDSSNVRDLDQDFADLTPSVRAARSARITQPPIMAVPPTGVIAPNQRGAPSAIA